MVRVCKQNAKITVEKMLNWIRLLPACTSPLWCISPPRWWWGSPWWPWPRIPHPSQQRQLVIMGQTCPWTDSLSCHSSSSSLDCFSLSLMSCLWSPCCFPLPPIRTITPTDQAAEPICSHMFVDPVLFFSQSMAVVHSSDERFSLGFCFLKDSLSRLYCVYRADWPNVLEKVGLVWLRENWKDGGSDFWSAICT